MIADEEGRLSLRRTCVELEIDETGVALSSSGDSSSVVSLVVLASARTYGIN